VFLLICSFVVPDPVFVVLVESSLLDNFTVAVDHAHCTAVPAAVIHLEVPQFLKIV